MAVKYKDLVSHKQVSEKHIESSETDFMTKYYAICHLQMLALDHPEILMPGTVSVLERLLKNRKYAVQRRGFALFRQTAETLHHIITRSPTAQMAGLARLALLNVLANATGYAHRTSAEALGTLPLDLRGPVLSSGKTSAFPRISWQKILHANKLNTDGPPRFFGRSLVFSIQKGRKLMVLKMSRKDDPHEDLLKEALWIEHLSSRRYDFGIRFDIPEGLPIENSHIFHLNNLPVKAPADLGLHPDRLAVAFLVHRDYFRYPNDHRANYRPGAERFKKIMCRNARLLGQLTTLGMVHSAPIPLFHNRVQRHRRRDMGVYEWFRAGRLDRWLDSCNYPNLGVTGPRDFEHLLSFDGSSLSLYRHIGAHLLSLLLVSGSYFRNRRADKVGLDKNGAPIDARDLFDPGLLKETVNGIFRNYYIGFTGAEYRGSPTFNIDGLVERMIDEMGVDRYMEEILRAPDQKDMSDEAFHDFLRRRRYTDDEIANLEKGAHDLTVMSGPHLGAFNNTISLPEIIESSAAMSAACISGKYWQEKYESRPFRF